MPKEIEIEFDDGSKIKSRYPSYEEIEAEWDAIAPMLALLGFFDVPALKEEE